ncbi:MAG TPA: prolipoprotein diacylglyceryl transferase [Pyrinomonadaceae bacterium]|nr:prolipoprotein diacylglyceryl transferase [Pyrinomonadaceae bacterium]
MRSRIVDFFMHQIGAGFFVPDYAIALSVAIVLGLYLTTKEGERAGLETERVWRVCVIAIAAALVSARLYVVLQDWNYYRQQPLEIFQIWKGGLASYGAYIGGGLAAILAARWQRLPVARFLDCCAPAIALAIVPGRLGCFLNGCCHGKISSLPWALRFPEDSGPYFSQLDAGLIAPHQLSLPVHPTQLYESVYALVIFFVLRGYRKKQKRDGELFAVLFAFYAFGRFLIEFLRDDDRGTFSFLSLPQVISVVIGGVAIWFLFTTRRKNLICAASLKPIT